jgi:hypothetical protein
MHACMHNLKMPPGLFIFIRNQVPNQVWEEKWCSGRQNGELNHSDISAIAVC